MKTERPNALARTLRAFFTDYLPGLRGMSPHTIQSYRDALVLLLRFLTAIKNTDTDRLDLADITPEMVISFLQHLETSRHNTVSTRNVRLAAIHAFFRYLAGHDPSRLEQAQQILDIPFKRTGVQSIDYLNYDEIQAVLNSVDRATAGGRRDYALLALMFNTGARVQEILDLHAHDLQLSRPYQVRLCGKGRKVRICPLWPQMAEVLRAFCAECGLESRTVAPVFLNRRGEPLTRFGVRYILAKYCQRAQSITPSLAGKKLHPHSMRHSTAIFLLKSGVDLVSISHWLGHANINTTHRYATLDLEMKREALARAKYPDGHPKALSSWRLDADLLTWLRAL